MPAINFFVYSFHFRLVTHFGALFLFIGVALTVYLDKLATATLNHAKSKELFSIALGSSQLLAKKLNEHEREIELLSKNYVLTHLDLQSQPVNSYLKNIRQSNPFYAWIGVVAPDGTVLSATDHLLTGDNVAHRPWFWEGAQGTYVGDVHRAILLEKHFGQAFTEPLRFIDFAAPVLNPDGSLRAVVAAHVNWAWVHDLLDAVLHSQIVDENMELLILGQQGQWLHPYKHIGQLAVPDNLPTSGQVSLLAWQGEGQYLTARINVHNAVHTKNNDLGWQVVLRQPKDVALTPVTALNKQLFLFSLFLLLLGILVAYWLASHFSSPIEQLAAIARKVAQGDQQLSFKVASSLKEVRHLSKALRSMTTTLAQRQHALENANTTLENKVALRTADLERANAALIELSNKDALSGIANRRIADEQLKILFNRLQRGGQVYAVLLLDIDHFKRINDNFGHNVGDQVIKRLANLLQSEVRDSDLVARYGGEEFVVLLPNTQLAGAEIIANKLCKLIAQETMPNVGKVTASFGVAVATNQHTDAEMVVRLADKAMYQAKHLGRNRVILAPNTDSNS